MKPERFDLIVWGVLGAIALALAAVLAAGDQVGARIVGAQPEPGASISARGQIVIEFAQPMNRASVESAFAISPPVPGRFFWQENTVTFAPTVAFARGAAYTARLNAGAHSQSGQAVKQDFRLSFTVRDPLIIFIAPAGEARELWTMPLGGEPQALTATGGRIYDFAVSPDGEAIVYTVATDAGGIDLWRMNRDGSDQRLLVDCGSDRCTAPNWAPDGSRLAFSRETVGLAPGAPHGPPRVWVLDFAGGQTAPLFADSQMLGYGPVWSPTGARIASWDGGVGGIRIYDLQTGDSMILKSQMGAVGSWSPDGAVMLYNDLRLAGETPYVKLFLADFALKEVRPAFEDSTLADYSVPVWSPDGAWVAAGVRNPESGLGSQLWIMRPDGSGGRPVADDPQYTYGAYRWSPWSDGLIFQRFALGVPFAKPEILYWSAADNSVVVLTQDASLPAWLP